MSSPGLAETLWWQSGVVYQIYPRSFKDSNGDGIGDIPGIIEKLDYVKDTLGIDAIWLSPFCKSPMKDFGYDVSDYTDVDPIFGTLDDFDRLTEEMDARGLRLIVDLVPNHSSDQHPWFVESRSSRDNPKRNWYVWADAKPDGSPPNNWLSVFGGGAWEWDETTQQFYLHSFLAEQPDLNWRNPEVQEAMLDAMRFWLRRGVDGFRVDVAHFLMKDPKMRDNPESPNPADFAHRPDTAYALQDHVYDKAHPDIHRVFRDMRRLVDTFESISPRMMVAEIHEYDWEKWAAYYGKDLDEFHMPFNFALLPAKWNAKEIRAVVDAVEAAVPQGAWPNYVLGNHDEPRIASRLGAVQSRIAAMLLLTLRGTPTLYYGDEIGMREADIPPDRQQDPFGRREPGQGRDGCRTPMQWDDTRNAGFSTANNTWLPVEDAHGTTNVDAQLDDPASHLALYRKLLSVRSQNPALQIGDYEAVDVSPPNCYVFRRKLPGSSLLVALNFGGEPTSLRVSDMKGKILVSTSRKREDAEVIGAIELSPNEGVVIKEH